MENSIKKLLIQAENCVWVMQNKYDEEENLEDFAIKLYELSQKIMEELKISY